MQRISRVVCKNKWKSNDSINWTAPGCLFFILMQSRSPRAWNVLSFFATTSTVWRQWLPTWCCPVNLLEFFFFIFASPRLCESFLRDLCDSVVNFVVLFGSGYAGSGTVPKWVPGLQQGTLQRTSRFGWRKSCVTIHPAFFRTQHLTITVPGRINCKIVANVEVGRMTGTRFVVFYSSYCLLTRFHSSLTPSFPAQR